MQVFGWSVAQWSNYLFSSSTGAYGTFLFPYFYTFGIALFILLGFAVLLSKESFKFDFLFFATTLVVIWIFSTSPIIGGFVRHVFVVFPLLMYFAAIGLQSRKFGLLMGPFFILMLWIPIQGYVPYVQDYSLPESFWALSITSAIAIVAIVVSDFFLKRKFPNFTIKLPSFKLPSLKVAGVFTIVLLLLTVVISTYSGIFLMRNGPLEVNEEITIDSIGVKEAAFWVNSNISQGSRIVTNNPYEFPYYLSTISSKNYTLLYPPGPYSSLEVNPQATFLYLIAHNWTDYLLIFTKTFGGNLEYWQFYPYIQNYATTAPLGMHEIYHSDTFVVYKTNG